MLNSFYETLYTSALPSDFQPEELRDLLDPLALGWLLDTERETLVQPFMALAVLNAIQSFPSGKSPSPDGLPILLSHTGNCWHHDWLRCTQIVCQGRLPSAMYHAYLTQIYKSLKDPTSCAYRPIALLNNDFKILTKLLVIRLYAMLPSVADSDQTGFMPHRATDVNLRR